MKHGLKQIRNHVLGFWKENYKDRLVLLGIITGVWVIITILEETVPERVIDKLPSNVPLSLLGIILIIVIIHNIYMFFAQFHRRRNPRPLNDSYMPSVDVFISAHNEERVIGATLEHIANHDYQYLKIYAINDRSTDGTLAIMEDVQKKYPERLRVINRSKDAFPGKSAALNEALESSDGEVVCVFDSDARIDNGFIREMVRHLEDPLVGGVQAQKVISNPEVNFLTKCQFHEYAMDTYLQMGRDSIRGSVELRGNGQLVKRAALDHVGGWNEETLTDDLDLSTCLHVNGWDIRFSPENKVYEEGVTTWQALVKQRRRWAEGSIRRYLNYWLQLATPGNLSIHQAFDTFVFMAEFGVPLWMACDIVYEVIRIINGRETYFSSLMLLSFMIGIVIFMNQFNGLRIYKKQGLFEALWNTVVTNAYLMGTWITIIMITYRKILFSRTMGKWVRTEHGVPALAL